MRRNAESNGSLFLCVLVVVAVWGAVLVSVLRSLTRPPVWVEFCHQFSESGIQWCARGLWWV